MRNKRGQPMLGLKLQIQGRVSDITEDGAGGRVFPRSATVEKRVANDIAAHKNRVEHMVHTGQYVRVRNQRRVHGNLNLRSWFFSSASCDLPFAVSHLDNPE